MMTSPLLLIFYVVILFRLRLSSVESISLEAGDGVYMGGHVCGMRAHPGGGYIPRAFS
jgi:hypothetical protein